MLLKNAYIETLFAHKTKELFYDVILSFGRKKSEKRRLGIFAKTEEELHPKVEEALMLKNRSLQDVEDYFKTKNQTSNE